MAETWSHTYENSLFIPETVNKELNIVCFSTKYISWSASPAHALDPFYPTAPQQNSRCLLVFRCVFLKFYFK